MCDRRGSEVNDSFHVENNAITTDSNYSGGIQGGISNGMPIRFCVGIKPTPSISQPQKTVSLSKNENTTLEIHGRHDPCIAQRAVPVIEAVAALVALDLLLYDGINLSDIAVSANEK